MTMNATQAGNPVPTIEALAPGLEAVVIPSAKSAWLSEGGMPVRAYVLACPPSETEPHGRAHKSPVVLIDCGYSDRLSIEAVSSALAGRPLEAILLTHAHPDHAGGAAAIAARHGAPVYAHPDVRKSRHLPQPFVAFEALEDGATLRFGRLQLAALATPGHAPGHLCYHLPASGALFTGDLLLGEGTVVVGPPDGRLAEYLESLERVRALEPLRVLYPGHGEPVTEPHGHVAAVLRHRRMRLAQIGRLLEQAPRTPNELLEAIYAGTIPEHLLPLALVSIAGSLAYLAEQGLALEREGRWHATRPNSVQTQ